MNRWNEALHGVQNGCADPTTPSDKAKHCPTSFPAAISTAASINRTLFYMIGKTVGTEARALANEHATDGLTFWSPNINIFRVSSQANVHLGSNILMFLPCALFRQDPRWGRGAFL
jgi:beta-glucosidase-like glycosyl hydrolase